MKLADDNESTQKLLDYATHSDDTEFLVATESGILHEMQKRCPQKNFIPVPPIDSTCGCNNCNFMRLNTLEKIYNCLLHETPEITIDENIRAKAVRPILKMLEMSK